MNPNRKAEPEALGYAEALEEVTAILDELEDESIDIDVLAERVERAAELIAICRGRIMEARLKVEEIVAELEDDVDDADT